MSRGPGIMQREILRRASARRSAFTVRQMAAKLFAVSDDSRRGAVRRACKGLVQMGFMKHDGGEYRRTSKPLSPRPEWKTPVEIVPIGFDEADAMLEGQHYLGVPGYRPAFCLSTATRDALAVFAPPVASHFKKSLPAPLELTRLWRTDDCPFPLSQFLSRALRWIKREAPETDCVFSYSDPAAVNPVTGRPHVGGVYAASNFAYLGTARATDHWITPDFERVSAPRCYRLFRTKSAAKIAAFRPDWEFVAGMPKSLFCYPMRLKLPAVLEAIGGDGKRYQGTMRPPQWLAKVKADLGDLY
jgi:hypothetical protein